MYLNQCCWCGKIRAFLDTSKEDWLAAMEQHYHYVTPHKLVPGDVRAWENCWDVLHGALAGLGEPYPDLHILFEYCLPGKVSREGQLSDYCVRADAIIVGRDTAVVLEFKNKPIPQDKLPMFARQAKKYRTRLQKYHDESRGMRKWAVLVPTQSQDLLCKPISRVTACSPDRLAQVLRAQFGEDPRTRKTIRAWKNSAYSVH